MEGRGYANKCSLQSCSDTEAWELSGLSNRIPNQSVASINLKEIRVSSKVPSQELFLSRGNQRVNL